MYIRKVPSTCWLIEEKEERGDQRLEIGLNIVQEKIELR